MNKVWMVSEGQYSDFRMIAAFSTKELAEEAKASGVGDDIYEFDINPEYIRPPAGMKYWHVQIDQDGNPPIRRGRMFQPYSYSGYTGTTINKTSVVCYRSGDGAYIVNCWARDEQHAIKIANEIRVQEIAKVSVVLEST